MATPAPPINAVGHRQGRYLLRMVSPAGPGFDPNVVAAEQETVLNGLAHEPIGRMINFLFGDNGTIAKLHDCYAPVDLDR